MVTQAGLTEFKEDRRNVSGRRQVRSLAVPGLRAEDYRPVANPTSTPVRPLAEPVDTTDTSKLLGALSGISDDLSGYLKEYQQRTDKENEAEGEAAAYRMTRQERLELIRNGLKGFEDPVKQRAFLAASGVRQATEDHAAIYQEYEANKNDLNFNVAELIGKHRSSGLETFNQDPYGTTAYSKTLDNLTRNLYIDKVQVDEKAKTATIVQATADEATNLYNLSRSNNVSGEDFAQRFFQTSGNWLEASGDMTQDQIDGVMDNAFKQMALNGDTEYLEAVRSHKITKFNSGTGKDDVIGTLGNTGKWALKLQAYIDESKTYALKRDNINVVDKFVSIQERAIVGSYTKQDYEKDSRERPEMAKTFAKFLFQSNNVNLSRAKEAQKALIKQTASNENNKMFMQMYQSGQLFTNDTAVYDDTGNPKTISAKKANELLEQTFITQILSREKDPQKQWDISKEFYIDRGLVNEGWKNSINQGGNAVSSLTAGGKVSPKTLEGFTTYRRLKAEAPHYLAQIGVDEKNRMVFEGADMYMRLDGTNDPEQAIAKMAEVANKTPEERAAMGLKRTDYKLIEEYIDDSDLSGDYSSVVRADVGMYADNFMKVTGLDSETAIEYALGRVVENYVDIHGKPVFAAYPGFKDPEEFGDYAKKYLAEWVISNKEALSKDIGFIEAIQYSNAGQGSTGQYTAESLSDRFIIRDLSGTRNGKFVIVDKNTNLPVTNVPNQLNLSDLLNIKKSELQQPNQDLIKEFFEDRTPEAIKEAEEAQKKAKGKPSTDKNISNTNTYQDIKSLMKGSFP